MNKEQTLEKLGLTNAETKVYLTLLKLGEAKAGDIIKKVSISSSNVHDALDKLAQKGLLSFVLKNKIKHHYPTTPDNLKQILKHEEENLKQKQEELKSLLPELNSIKAISGITQNAELFFGLQGIKSGFAKLFETKAKQFSFFYKYDKSNVEMVNKFFAKMDIEEEYYSKTSTRGLFSKEYKQHFQKRKASFQAKFTDHPIPSSVNIYGDKVLLISWSDSPTGVLIQSKEIATTFESLFNEVWAKTAP